MIQSNTEQAASVSRSPDYITLGYEYDNVQRELDRTPNHVDRWHVLMDRAAELRRQANGE
jgi:hypothetical protein